MIRSIDAKEWLGQLPYSTVADAEPINTILRVLGCGPEWGRAESGRAPPDLVEGHSMKRNLVLAMGSFYYWSHLSVLSSRLFSGKPWPAGPLPSHIEDDSVHDIMRGRLIVVLSYGHRKRRGLRRMTLSG